MNILRGAWLLFFFTLEVYRDISSDLVRNRGGGGGGNYILRFMRMLILIHAPNLNVGLANIW